MTILEQCLAFAGIGVAMFVVAVLFRHQDIGRTGIQRETRQ
jgi:hypothetical protein